MLSGSDKRVTFFYELALFIAWHSAAFANQAQHGKLEPWESYRKKLRGTTATPAAPQQDWRERKRERQRQMELYKQHQQAKKRPAKVRRG